MKEKKKKARPASSDYMDIPVLEIPEESSSPILFITYTTELFIFSPEMNNST